ncbi:Uma2 family endonuclease [Thermoactinospora rubra]|uniref:Uma2 family endonuclease n=1 Tax=Thermoactinospora rubra TaxID=1088767 RepID=UPI000A100871|nr:Uma2 family endonuclease [Thermoactinospora rubra]
MTEPSNDWFRDYRPQTCLLTAEDYDNLDEEVCRRIEVIDGFIISCEAPSRDHQRAVRRLADLVEKHARAAMAHGHPCLEVDFDVDLRLRDVPLFNLRPDVVLYRCLDRGRNERLKAEHALLVIEVVSPSSETRDTTDKVGEYAKAGIPNYWIVWLDTTGISTIERYRLERVSRTYKHIGTFMKDEAGEPPLITNPIPITIDWDQLEF